MKTVDNGGSTVGGTLVQNKATVDEVLSLLGNLRMYDISPTFSNNMPGFFEHPTLGIVDDARTYEKHGYFTQTLVLCEHNGSHVDAPKHIHKTMDSIDSVPCDFLIGPYKKYDLTMHNPERGKNLTLKQIKEVEERDHIVLEPDDIVLLQFGWDKYFRPDSNDPADQMMYSFGPGIAEEVSIYFAGARVRAIGSDVVSTDTAYPGMPGHLKHTLPKYILLIEGLVNLAAAPVTGIFAALPWKIRGGSGSPISPILWG